MGTQPMAAARAKGSQAATEAMLGTLCSLEEEEDSQWRVGARNQAAAPGRVNLQYCISSVGRAAARAVWGPAAHYARTGTISCRCWARPLLEQRWYTGQGGWFDTRKIVKTIDKTMTSSSTALSSQGSGRAMARPETWHWTEQQKAWRPSSQASLSFLALLVDVYRSRCLRPVSRWSPLSHYIRLHRLGCTTAASTRGHCWSWSPPWGWTRPGVCWLGWCGRSWCVPSVKVTCGRCCCVVVTWLAGVRLTARWDQRLLLSPHSCCHLQLLSNTRHTAVTSSTRKQPIPSHTILPCPASGQNLKQGRANIIDWIIFMGAVVEETILKECRGVLVGRLWVRLGLQLVRAGRALPPSLHLSASHIAAARIFTTHCSRCTSRGGWCDSAVITAADNILRK